MGIRSAKRVAGVILADISLDIVTLKGIQPIEHFKDPVCKI